MLQPYPLWDQLYNLILCETNFITLLFMRPILQPYPLWDQFYNLTLCGTNFTTLSFVRSILQLYPLWDPTPYSTVYLLTQVSQCRLLWETYPFGTLAFSNTLAFYVIFTYVSVPLAGTIFICLWFKVNHKNTTRMNLYWRKYQWASFSYTMYTCHCLLRICGKGGIFLELCRTAKHIMADATLPSHTRKLGVEKVITMSRLIQSDKAGCVPKTKQMLNELATQIVCDSISKRLV